jgi:nicotinate-nucleotide pyrophosphorylase (carboxylating)
VSLFFPKEYKFLMPDYSHLLPVNWKSAVTQWLVEDTPSFDYGGFVVGESIQSAQLFCKSSGVLAGVPFFDEVFKQVGCDVEWKFKEGHDFEIKGKERIVVAIVTGPSRKLLLGERPALNMLARASGIASRAAKLRDLKVKNNWKGVVAATRKTTPGYLVVYDRI